jgi:cation transport ATPase
MKDDFREIPKIIELAKETIKVSRQDFYIWGFSNILGLALVFSGIIGPAGAAAYNFLTDFLPLGNSIKLFRKNHFN